MYVVGEFVYERWVLCMPMNVQAGAREVFHSSFPPYFMQHGLSLNQKLDISSWLAGQQGPRICLSLPSNARVTVLGNYAQLSHGCWEIELKSPCLHIKSSYTLIHFPTLELSLLTTTPSGVQE